MFLNFGLIFFFFLIFDNLKFFLRNFFFNLFEWLHWIVLNFKNKVEDGDEIISYQGPSPPHDTGDHRYVFTHFETEEPIDFHEKIKERSHWSLKNFVEKYHLEDPLEANFFFSRE